MNRTFPRCLWQVVLPLLEDLNTPRSLTVKLLIEHGEFEQLVNLKVAPAHYAASDPYFRDCVATELLRKNVDLKTGIDRDKVAREGFYTAEMQCFHSNVLLSRVLNNGPFLGLEDVRDADFLHRVKRRVSLILRKLPRDLFSSAHFGPGATFNDRGHASTVPHKMSSIPTLTSSVRSSCFFGDWLTSQWAASVDDVVDGDVDIVPGNRFVSVPKDATKNRGIAVEPSINMFYQLALGRIMRRRLRHYGIDLDDGQDLHRRLAEEASRTGMCATIDLSSASDTICKKLVEFLLPADWFWALNTLRSPTTNIDGRTVHLEKFSSMGNGYTFELETLIFFSISIEACRDCGVEPIVGYDITVFGDDIIVPSECATTVLQRLQMCGFSPNERKTFISGHFRESCGGDFFDGFPVRGHYLEEYPNVPSQWISFANGLRRMSANYSGGLGLVDPFRRAWHRAVDQIPKDVRSCRGPEYLGDIVIHTDSDGWTTRNKMSTIQFRCFVAVHRGIPLERWGSGVTQLAALLLGTPSTGPIPRGPVSGYKIKWLPDMGDTHPSSIIRDWEIYRLLLVALPGLNL